MLDNTPKWSHARGNTVVPSRWQATLWTRFVPQAVAPVAPLPDNTSRSAPEPVSAKASHRGPPVSSSIPDSARASLPPLHSMHRPIPLGSGFYVLPG